MSTVKHLLPPVEKYFKANLHTHTTISDGKLKPQAVKELYKSKGYSILCLTDHDVVVDHSDMNDEDFLMLTGAEYDITQNDVTRFYKKTYHMNFIAKQPDLLWQPFANETYREEVRPYLEKATIEDMLRVYDANAINTIIARANEKGHLVMYNHPVWSLQDYTDYAPLKGLWGIELTNHECVYVGYDDANNSVVYRDLMNLHGSIYPVCTDDSHLAASTGGGWIMVGAQKLEYSSVIDALEKGDFYASTGPEIYSLTWDGTYLDISCSDARYITVESGLRFAQRVKPVHNDGLLRNARFDLSSWIERCEGNPKDWIRIVVHGPYGHYASTRAYTYEELK